MVTSVWLISDAPSLMPRARPAHPMYLGFTLGPRRQVPTGSGFHHHPRQDRGRLQVDEQAHKGQKRDAPHDHAPEDIALAPLQPDGTGRDGEVLWRDHLPEHAASG